MKDFKELYKRFVHAVKVVIEGVKYTAKSRKK
jgi:hypothetical protein